MRCILVILASVLSAMAVNANEHSISAYDFSFKTISGEPLPFSEFRGKVVMVVNTASECGFTGQYKNLQTVWSRYRDKGFVVLEYLPMTSATKHLEKRLNSRPIVK